MSQPVGLQYKSRIPSFGDDASVEEAFKVYHYGVDDWTSQPIPDNSIEGNFRSLNTSVTAINSTIANLPNVYIAKSATSSSTNIITSASATVAALTIRGASAQTENLQRWQNSAATNLAIIFSNGAISSNSYLNVGAITQSTTTAANVIIGNAAHKGIVVKQAAGQSVNTQEWQNSSDVTIATISSVGYLGIGSGVTSTTTGIDLRIISAGHKGFTIRSASSQSANLQEWQDSSGIAISWVDSDGRIYSRGDEVAAGVGSFFLMGA